MRLAEIPQELNKIRMKNIGDQVWCTPRWGKTSVIAIERGLFL